MFIDIQTMTFARGCLPMSSSNTTNNNNNNIQNKNINPRPCVYGSGIQIYWNSSVNQYWEVFTKKKHICPNRGNKSSGTTLTLGTDGIIPPSTSLKPHYYNPYARKRTLYASFAGQQQPKPKMSNSCELLQGDPIANIQKQYEMLSDILTEHKGKVHGSQEIEILKQTSLTC